MNLTCAEISIHEVDLAFMRSDARKILATTPIEYLKSPQLRGTLFEEYPSTDPGVISSIFTEFYVDHNEPLAALKPYRSAWPLGVLLDGHEYLILVHVVASPWGSQ
jgi:hypothetical protein